MINLGLDDKPIMEDAKSVIHNTIKDTANIDTNEIRDIWSNSQKGVLKPKLRLLVMHLIL